MAADPPKDPLFDNVERWQAELDERYSRQFGIIVTAAVISIVIVLIAMMFLNGCTPEEERSPPTLPTIVTTTTGVDHITVPTTTTISP